MTHLHLDITPPRDLYHHVHHVALLRVGKERDIVPGRYHFLTSRQVHPVVLGVWFAGFPAGVLRVGGHGADFRD